MYKNQLGKFWNPGYRPEKKAVHALHGDRASCRMPGAVPTKDNSKVTCKTCLKMLRKRGEKCQKEGGLSQAAGQESSKP